MRDWYAKLSEASSDSCSSEYRGRVLLLLAIVRRSAATLPDSPGVATKQAISLIQKPCRNSRRAVRASHHRHRESRSCSSTVPRVKAVSQSLSSSSRRPTRACAYGSPRPFTGWWRGWPRFRKAMRARESAEIESAAKSGS